MEISAQWFGAGITAAVAVGGVLVRWTHSAVRDERDARERDIAALKATQKVLFDRYDKLSEDFNDYRLHVAETYVAEAKLEKMFEPLNRRLENIEEGLRAERGRNS